MLQRPSKGVFINMYLLTAFLLACFMTCTSEAHPLQMLAISSVSSKLEPAAIQAVFKNSTSEYKFMFPNVPADELDSNYNEKFPFRRPNSKQKHSEPDINPSSAAVVAEVLQDVAEQLQRPDVVKRAHGEVMRIPETKNHFDSAKRQFLSQTMQKAIQKSTISRQPDVLTSSQQNSLNRIGQTTIHLSPEEMEEINETGRLCSEDGECIYFTDDWGSNCCPFG